jgi:hypothetical protein
MAMLWLDDEGGQPPISVLDKLAAQRWQGGGWEYAPVFVTSFDDVPSGSVPKDLWYVCLRVPYAGRPARWMVLDFFDAPEGVPGLTATYEALAFAQALDSVDGNVVVARSYVGFQTSYTASTVTL